VPGTLERIALRDGKEIIGIVGKTIVESVKAITSAIESKNSAQAAVSVNCASTVGGCTDKNVRLTANLRGNPAHEAEDVKSRNSMGLLEEASRKSSRSSSKNHSFSSGDRDRPESNFSREGWNSHLRGKPSTGKYESGSDHFSREKSRTHKDNVFPSIQSRDKSSSSSFSSDSDVSTESRSFARTAPRMNGSNFKSVSRRVTFPY